MKRARAVVLVAVVLVGGCAHWRLGDGGPGDVDLAQPPAALAARGPTRPTPALDRALVVSPGVLAGIGGRHGGGVLSSEGGLGFELGLYATRIQLHDTVLGEGGRDYGWGDRPRWWGINLGWTPTTTRSAEQRRRQPSAYVEGQWRNSELLGIAGGVAFTPEDARRARTGVQVAPLCGPLYWRFQMLLDGNYAFEFGVAFKIPVVISWGS